MLLHPSSHTTPTQSDLIKSQGLSPENFICAGSCRGGGKQGRQGSPRSSFSSLPFSLRPPLFSHSPPPVADRWQLRLAWGLGWADGGIPSTGTTAGRQSSPRGLAARQPPELGRGPFPSTAGPPRRISAGTRGTGYRHLILHSQLSTGSKQIFRQ